MAGTKGRAKAAPEPKDRKPKAAKASDPLAALRAELAALAETLDADGLGFLIEQAKVHRYNMEVERLDAMAAELDASAAGARSGPAAASRGGASVAPPRFVAGEDGSTFHLVWKGEYKLFGRDEILALLRAVKAGPAAGAGARLWAWLERERGDAIADLALSGPRDPAVAELAGLAIATFEIRKRP